MQASMPLQPQQQQQQQPQQQPQNIPTYYQYSPSHIQYPIGPEPTNSPTFCYNCQNNNQHGNNMDNETRIKATVIEELANKTSLEDLVKLVVAAVKDAGVLGRSDKKQESPEEILRRKRQQNNEAAARYRKRQREAKMNAGNELEKLETRNFELKAELTSLQDQINNLKRCITTSTQHTSTLSKS
uniref:BZIP domain-containing protein n=1 Tax=Panagrolaimus superbus TaxID=310955 RepID=A0A914XZJ9_9BILA